MRYAPQHKSNTHKKIVTAASELFRAEGIRSVGVTELMQRAGLTHGGFYAHFTSKEDLAAQACLSAFEESGQRLKQLIEEVEPGRKFATAVERYLNATHRDNSLRGCMAAALATEVTHHPGPIRDAMTAGIKQWIEGVEKMIAQDGLQIDSYSAVATMIGAIVLARAAADPKLSDQLLSHARDTLLASVIRPTPRKRRSSKRTKESSRRG
jgi:TetR/AcrR family transcriptional regulator, transcriptional repressor for nem operon